MNFPTLVLALATVADGLLLLFLYNEPHSTPLLIACRYVFLFPALVLFLRASRRNV